jgi:hypothetical protein
MFSSVWFLTLFSSFNAMDLPTTLLLWDRFLTCGWAEIFKFGLAVMKALEVCTVCLCGARAWRVSTRACVCPRVWRRACMCGLCRVC